MFPGLWHEYFRTDKHLCNSWYFCCFKRDTTEYRLLFKSESIPQLQYLLLVNKRTLRPPQNGLWYQVLQHITEGLLVQAVLKNRLTNGANVLTLSLDSTLKRNRVITQSPVQWVYSTVILTCNQRGKISLDRRKLKF